MQMRRIREALSARASMNGKLNLFSMRRIKN